MNIEEVQKVLDELKEVEPKKLNKEAKRLFEAIMKIADERDELKSDLYEANMRINDLLDSSISKDKIKAKIDEIMEEHSKILADDKRSLMEQNIASHQYVAMRTVLEELLEEDK